MKNRSVSHIRPARTGLKRMHIPDGFLDTPTAAATAALALAGVAVALRRARQGMPPRQVPLIGLAAAFVFAAQMLNFPVAAGTSGHLMGGVLVAVLLGPAAAVVVMTAVLVLQCFMFADGGVTALGANVLNIGLVPVLAGYGIYRLVRTLAGPGDRALLLAAGFAAWCSTVIAAAACAIELSAAGVVSLKLALPAMAGVHMLIGLGEAAITMLVLVAVMRSRPELLAAAAAPGRPAPGARWAVLGVLAALVLLAPFASSLPDGLEHVAERLGFAGRAGQALGAPLPDYALPALDSPLGATLAAGAVGTLVAFLLAWLLARMLAPARPPG
jgi:cobalt/nickel transport system permease protein